MKVDDKKEDIYFEHYNPEELEKAIDTQTKIITYMKDQKLSKLHSILIVVDDHADDPNLDKSCETFKTLTWLGNKQYLLFYQPKNTKV